MAVTKKSESTESVGQIEISNGDWQSLKRVAGAYGVKDEADVIAFAIGVLDKSNGSGVVIESAEGRMKYVPSEKLKKPAQK